MRPLAQPASSPLATAAQASFLLLVAVLPLSVAPMSIATGVCGALSLAWVVTRGGPAWPRTPIEWPMVAWLLALLLASLTSEQRGASLLHVKKGLFPLLVPLAALHAPDARRGGRALAVLLVSSAAAALYGLAVFIAEGASFASRASGVVGHYMTFAGQLMLPIVVAASIAWLVRDRRWRLLASACALAGLAALAATFTRSSWIGLLAALLVVVAATRPRWVPFVLAGSALALMAAPPEYRARALSAFDPHHPWNRERTYMWEAGVRMFRDHPLTGVGLQDLRPIYERYRSPLAHEPAGHLHNVYIHTAATMGLVGLAAFAWLVASLFRCTTRGLRLRPPAPDVATALRLGMTAALVGFLVAGLFEWNFGDEELLYMLYTLIGLAWAARNWSEPGPAPASAAP